MILLAVDDDVSQLERLKIYCTAIEYPKVTFLEAEDVAAALRIAKSSVVDLVLTDLHLPDGSGFDVLKGVKGLNPRIAVAVMTAYSDTREAVELLKGGADDYLVKPTRKDDIEGLLLHQSERLSLIHEALLPLVKGEMAPPEAQGIIYSGEKMAGVMSVAARAAASAATVLLTGESGTGKELVARFIHERSGRKGAFVAVNISALPESLAESELFGHRKGAFTGADSDRMGRFEEAEGGTLFLDEIGEISLPLQVKLLRAIQFGQIERVGENAVRHLDVRIVTATNLELAELVAGGKFRRDLYYRLNVIQIRLPPLRERKEDIALLVSHFIDEYRRRDGKEVKGISHEALDRLSKRPFPGNVRELENIIERAVVLCRGDVIRTDDLPLEDDEAKGGHAPGPAAQGYEAAMREFEGELLSQALEQSGGNQSAAARSLGITERHLRSRLERLG
jgi:DNA-binding NtrC family response regulator